MNQLVAMDTRFWEVWDAEGKSLGIFQPEIWTQERFEEFFKGKEHFHYFAP